MRLRITNPMLEIRNRKTLQSKVNICKSDVKIGDYADSLLFWYQMQQVCIKWVNQSHSISLSATVYDKVEFCLLDYLPYM